MLLLYNSHPQPVQLHSLSNGSSLSACLVKVPLPRPFYFTVPVLLAATSKFLLNFLDHLTFHITTPVLLYLSFCFPNSIPYFYSKKSASRFEDVKITQFVCTWATQTFQGRCFRLLSCRSCTGWDGLNKYFQIWCPSSAMSFQGPSFRSSHLLKISGTQSVSYAKGWGLYPHLFQCRTPVLRIFLPFFPVPCSFLTFFSLGASGHSYPDPFPVPELRHSERSHNFLSSAPQKFTKTRVVVR